MFAIDCHIHESRVLLDWSRVEGVHDGPEGPVLDWQCWCGARGGGRGGRGGGPREGVELMGVGHPPLPPAGSAPPDKVAS